LSAVLIGLAHIAGSPTEILFINQDKQLPGRKPERSQAHVLTCFASNPAKPVEADRKDWRRLRTFAGLNQI
jgi:hypothetical protein